MKDVLSVVASNPEGHFLAWRHLKAHWKGLQNLFGNGTFSMGALIGVVTSHFSAPYDLHEVGIKETSKYRRNLFMEHSVQAVK